MEDFKIYSIGYGNTNIGDFINILKEFDIRLILDVRAKPYSKWNSAYIKKNLEKILEGTGIKYRWVEPLRGRTEDKFSHYYDALRKVLECAEKFNTVLMCSELDPRKCHRYFKLTPDLEKFKKVNHIYRGQVVDPENIQDKKPKPKAETKKKEKSMQLLLL